MVSEVALAVVLLVGASLLLRTFSSLARVDLGFRPEETITMNLFLGLRPAEKRIALVDQILERVEALPGVKAASTIQFLPLSGMNCGTGFWLEGQTPREPRTRCPRSARSSAAAISPPWGYRSWRGDPSIAGTARPAPAS